MLEQGASVAIMRRPRVFLYHLFCRPAAARLLVANSFRPG